MIARNTPGAQGSERLATAPGPRGSGPKTSEASPVLLRIRDLEKSFGPNKVLRKVNLEVAQGSVHGLLGANGAGKSTLIKILDAVHDPDGGSITLTRRDGSGAPGTLGVVHQDLGLVDGLTVNDNLHLGARPRRRAGLLIDRRHEQNHTRALLAAVNLDVEPNTVLAALSLGQKSLVAIAKLLAEEPDVIVLDEVTAALSQAEAQWFLSHVRTMANAGSAVLVVTHRLTEAAEMCDRITVLRDGKVAYEGDTPHAGALHAILVGDSHDSQSGRGDAVESHPAAGADRTVLIELCRASSRTLDAVDVAVHSGEVLAMVGSASSKLYDLGHLLAGRADVRSGQRLTSTRSGRAGGRVAFLPEDRRAQALLPGLSVSENMNCTTLRTVSRLGKINATALRARTSRWMTTFDVRPNDTAASIETLSGGNQQKVLLARAALEEPDVYVLCEPTRGVDVETRRRIHRFVLDEAQRGAAIVYITTDVDDALAVAHEVCVVEDGVPGPSLSNGHPALMELIGKM